jgi:hypothetical protein
MSRWREFSFALHQLQHAIQPMLPLADVMGRWAEIAISLAERVRNRLPQFFS